MTSTRFFLGEEPTEKLATGAFAAASEDERETAFPVADVIDAAPVPNIIDIPPKGPPMPPGMPIPGQPRKDAPGSDMPEPWGPDDIGDDDDPEDDGPDDEHERDPPTIIH